MNKLTENKVRRPLFWLQILIVTITLFAIAVVIFLGSQTRFETRRMAVEQFNQQQLILARSTASGIEVCFKELNAALSSLAKIPSVQLMTPECLQCVQHTYWSLPSTTSIRLLGRNGGLRFIYPFDGWRGGLIGRNYSEEAYFQETSDHLNNLIRYTNAPIIVWNPDKKITIFNEAFEEMSGRSEAEMVGQLLDVLFPEESRSDSLRKIESASKGEYWETVEIPILHKDGNIRIGLWNSANIYGEDGKTLIATIAQGQDITERKRTEDALRKSEERYRTLQTNIPVGIFRTTPEGKFLSANPTLIKMLGYDSQEELLVTSVVDIYITPEQRQEFIKRMNKEGLVVDFEVKLRRKDGLTFWGSLSATAVTDRTGKVIHYDGILEDITEHKHAEQELKKRLDQLEIYYKATMGREGRIVELKREVNELSEQLGKEKKYGV